MTLVRSYEKRNIKFNIPLGSVMVLKRDGRMSYRRKKRRPNNVTVEPGLVRHARIAQICRKNECLKAF